MDRTAGRDELLSYITLAGNLGHARGRWGALTRQATFAHLRSSLRMGTLRSYSPAEPVTWTLS
jgi:hypothetical protein